ncbi:MAG: VWA domain-containing protein [Pseudomonadota bacterium]|nr:VWA domain-containing protein [Pseudomonadota bacterium]
MVVGKTFSLLVLAVALLMGCSTYDGLGGGELASGNVPLLPVANDGSVELHWHFPCEDGEVSHAQRNDFVGTGHNWLMIQTIKTLKISISGQVCADSSGRDAVFVIDTSGSMSVDKFKNSGCARYDALKTLAAKIHRSESLNVGLVLFSNGAKCLASDGSDRDSRFRTCGSANLIPAQNFQEIISSADVARAVCHDEGGTSYESAFSAAEQLFGKGASGNRKEIYFFSDGEPNKKDRAKNAANKIKEYGFIATIGFTPAAGNFLRPHIASVVKGKPAHRQAENIEDLSAHFSDLLATNHAIGTLEWERYGSSSDSGTADLGSLIDADGGFTLPAQESGMSFDVSAPLAAQEPSGVLMKLVIQPGFGSDSEYVMDADLRFE